MDNKGATTTYGFCTLVAIFLTAVGVWEIVKEGRLYPILLFCWGAGAAFYLAGLWVRVIARRAAGNA